MALSEEIKSKHCNCHLFPVLRTTECTAVPFLKSYLINLSNFC